MVDEVLDQWYGRLWCKLKPTVRSVKLRLVE